MQMGAPKFDDTSIVIKGLGNVPTKTLGKFIAEIRSDEHNLKAGIHIVPDEVMPMKFIVGKPILNQMTLTISPDGMKLMRLNDAELLQSAHDRLAEQDVGELSGEDYMFLIKAENHLSIGKLEHEGRIAKMVANYKPKRPKKRRYAQKLFWKMIYP